MTGFSGSTSATTGFGTTTGCYLGFSTILLTDDYLSGSFAIKILF